ncbi:MAG: nucleotidyl transferase AbiEii/AbiGii toxin family protein [Deltaproteobacteria bacterium]|nr:nucleotidyl transferase AbiEii/AbiGii toxin family protein [Deltaproteobacteria bacterium]
MISMEQLEKLARKSQTPLFPNIIREYFQHIFLERLYRDPQANQMLFKGGTALRIVYGSPRFSEDLDFSIFGSPQAMVPALVEGLLIRVLAGLEESGIKVELGTKSQATSGGYFGTATLELPGFVPLGIVLNVSSRQKEKVKGEVDVIAGDFTSTYTLIHLPQERLVEEKVFGALRERKKPRDFYDLYFMMRKGMLSAGQKKRLAVMREEILQSAKKADFRRELGVFLPADQQAIIRDFSKILDGEMKRQLG